MSLKPETRPLQLLDYARPCLATVRAIHMVAVGIVVLVAGAMAAWCIVHTTQVILEIQRVARVRPIDFDPSTLGMPAEQSIPLGVLSGGIALVAFVHGVRLWNRQQSARPGRKRE